MQFVCLPLAVAFSIIWSHWPRGSHPVLISYATCLNTNTHTHTCSLITSSCLSHLHQIIQLAENKQAYRYVSPEEKLPKYDNTHTYTHLYPPPGS